MTPSQPTPQLRRPPAPRDTTATVTRLAPSPRQREQSAVEVASVQGTLALDLDRRAVPSTPELSVVPDPAPDQRATEVRAWAARFAQAVVEVTGGDRPLQQLMRWTSARVYHELGRRVQILAQTRSAPQRMRTVRPQVRSVHVSQPAPSVAEVSVHVGYGRRSRALAARLELREGHWTCTALLLG